MERATRCKGFPLRTEADPALESPLRTEADPALGSWEWFPELTEAALALGTRARRHLILRTARNTAVVG